LAWRISGGIRDYARPRLCEPTRTLTGHVEVHMISRSSLPPRGGKESGMAEQGRILVVTPGDREPGPSTPGMERQQAVATKGMWSGVVRTEAGMVSGWHHHGEYETTIYVLTGALKMEFGRDGSNTVEAGPGDFVYVPKGVVHRERNPSAVPADIVVVRAGWGDSTVNVDGPA
jgi:uncharacterized RmlC-like cupin family protein